MRHIFFDLDGTLIDSKQRLYKLFRDLVPELPLSFEEYWSLKMQQVDHEKILAQYSATFARSFHEFQNEWMRLIEHEQYLDLDAPFPQVRSLLDKLRENGERVIIVTSRQSKSSVQWQFDKWGWQQYLDDCLVTKQETGKAALIRSNFPSLDLNDIIIGDTGKDIETGKQLGMTTIAVLTGFQSRESLLKYAPHLIIDAVWELDFKKFKKIC